MRTVGVVLQDKSNLKKLIRHLSFDLNVKLVSRQNLGSAIDDAGFINIIGDPLSCREIFTDQKRITSKAESCFYIPRLGSY